MTTIRYLKAFAAFALTCGMVLVACSPDIIAASKEAEAKKATEDLKKSKDNKVRIAALQKLGELGLIQYAYVEPAVPDVFKAIKDSDAGVRAAAARTLGMIGPDDKETVPQLAGLLQDKDENVKLAAAEGLAYMGKKAEGAVKDLRAAAKDLDAKSKLAKTINNTIKTINGSKKKA
jgi:HEAT repeat protein